MNATHPRLLLHVCCACCATHAIERTRDDYAVTLFFSNSNIAPRAEHDLRLENAHRLAAQTGLPLLADAYDHDTWRSFVRGMEDEPERGLRCERCFEFSLGRAAAYAVSNGFDRFTTTLTVSPHKHTPTIFRVGREKGPFLEIDLKKRGGFQRTIELSRQFGLYRQDYCGCEFSHRPTRAPDAPAGNPHLTERNKYA